MTQFPQSPCNEPSIHAALELSKNNWLLAIQAPDRDNPSLHPLKGGNAEGLMAKLDAASDRVAKVMGERPKVTLCYEAGYDGFWLARFLEERGIGCLVMEPASLQVNRRARRVKTDRIDVESILHTLIAWCRGEHQVCSMVVIPSVEEEDLRRSHHHLTASGTGPVNPRADGPYQPDQGPAVRSGHTRHQRQGTLQEPDAGNAGHGRRPALGATPRPGDHTGDREAGPAAGADRRDRG